jgi:hypothetical protein
MEKEMLVLAKFKEGEGKFEKFMGFMQSPEGLAERQKVAVVEKTVASVTPDKSAVMFKIFCTDEEALQKFIEGTEVSKPIMDDVMDSYTIYDLTKVKEGNNMSILAKYNAAMEAKDEAAMNEILHDDYKFTMHASGNVLGKADVIKWAMSGDINRDKIRVIFENDEIGVEHSFVSFNDGNTEAVMAVFKYQDGKIISLETGATKIPK